MFLFKIISFLFGHVNILIRGNNLEKFINMAVSRGIYLWDIRRVGEKELFVRTRLSAVRPLRHIGRQTKNRFEFREREGLPFIVKRLRGRKSLVIGAVIFLMGLYTLSSFVWFIDIKGNNKLATETILKTAAEAGLKVGSVKFKVDEKKVENLIKERIPEVSYVGVDISGTRANIEISEKIIIQKEVAQPTNIIAKKAGLVKEVLVLVGSPAVKEGDTVVSGQVLISGVIQPQMEEEQDPAGNAEQEQVLPPIPPTYVQAKGIVRARVWYEGYGEVPFLEEGSRQTGLIVDRFCIKIGGKEIILSGRNIPFDNYVIERDVKKIPSWRNIVISVEVISEKYIEMEDFKVQRTHDEALQLATKKAVDTAKSKIEPGANIIYEQTREVSLKNPENLVRVKTFIETLEDIGMEKTIN